MDLWEALEKRRSIRKYKNTPVSKEILLKLVNAAKLAPNNANVQPWEFVFITEADLVAKMNEHILTTMTEYWSKARVEEMPEEKLNKIIKSTTSYGPVPAYLLVCINTSAGKMRKDYIKWNDMWSHYSVAAALSNLMLAAVEEGLGTCWLGVPSWNTNELKKELGIPDEVQIISVSPIGYPDEDPAPRPRKTAEEITHFNKW